MKSDLNTPSSSKQTGKHLELFFLRKNRGLLKREGGLGYDNPAKHTPHKKITRSEDVDSEIGHV